MAVMNIDLEHSKNDLVSYFLEQGLDPLSIYKLIQRMAYSLFFAPDMTLLEINEALKQSACGAVRLHEDVFQQVKACLVMEGRKGIEYRLGEGFKQALNRN